MKRNLSTPWYLVFNIIQIVSCGAPQNLDTTKEAMTAIEASNNQWMAAFEKGDAAGIA